MSSVALAVLLASASASERKPQIMDWQTTQLQLARDAGRAHHAAELGLQHRAAPVGRAHGEAVPVADREPRRAAGGAARRHARGVLDDAAALERVQRHAQRPVAEQHAERAVAAAEGCARDLCFF